jgi:hypothetical protein
MSKGDGPDAAVVAFILFVTVVALLMLVSMK